MSRPGRGAAPGSLTVAHHPCEQGSWALGTGRLPVGPATLGFAIWSCGLGGRLGEFQILGRLFGCLLIPVLWVFLVK